MTASKREAKNPWDCCSTAGAEEEEADEDMVMKAGERR